MKQEKKWNLKEFERIFNIPKRGLGTASMKIIYKLARDEKISLFDASKRILSTDELRVKARKNLQFFLV